MKLSLRAVTVGVCMTAGLLVACGSDGTSGSGGTGADAGGTGNNPPGTIPGGGNGTDAGGTGSGSCAGTSLLDVPADTGAHGPWQVGAKTVTIAGFVTEIWYPAKPGSDAGKTKVQYDLREHLPTADQTKIPDADNPLQPCDCFRDLPFDDAHGPYPVVAFVHGTAGFRTQSLTFNTHWASRGFVVVSSDHPGIMLKDILGGGIGLGADQAGDTVKLLDALKTPSGDAAFLAGHIDMARVGAEGHSAGGGAVAGLGDRAKVIIPMAARGDKTGTALVSTLVMGAVNDGIASFAGVKNGYTSSPKKKRFVALANAGHLAFSDLCSIGKDKGGILKVASDHGVNVPQLVATLAQDGCGATQLSPEAGWAIVNRATSAVLEETLSCSTTAAAQLSGLKASSPDVSDYQEDL